MSGYYRYYDSPDGQDFFKKEYYLMRRAFPFCCYFGWLDVMAFTAPFGVIPCAVRFFQVFSRPIIGLSLWNITTFMSTRLRNKDDGINHALGVIPVAFYMRNFLPNTACYCFAIPSMIICSGAKQFKIWYPNYALYGESSTFRDNVDNSIFADYLSYLSLSIKDKNWLTIEDAVKKGIVGSVEEAKEKKLTNYKDGQVRGLIRVGDGSENLETILNV